MKQYYLSRGVAALVVVFALILGFAPHTHAGGGNYNWSSKNPSGNHTWVDIAGSSDGSVLVTPDLLGYLYVSTTTGQSWTPITSIGSKQWYTVTSSASGSLLAAGAFHDYIFLSTTTGSTWATSTASGVHDWVGISSSGTGSVIAAAVSGGDIYISTTTGATWTDAIAAGSRGWQDITVSTDGSMILAGVWGGDLYLSTTTGATWTHVTGIPAQDWIGMASSADGSHLAAASYSDATFTYSNGGIWTSSNYGATWTQTSAPQSGYYALSSSADGSVLGAAAGWGYGPTSGAQPLGYFYSSRDGGAHWVREDTLGQDGWNGSVLSPDGTRVVTIGGQVWTGLGWAGIAGDATAPPQAPTLSISSRADGVPLSNLSSGSGAVSSVGVSFVAPGTATTTRAFSAGGSMVLSLPLTGLSCGTTYSVWGFATNALGTTNSAAQPLTTEACVSGSAPSGGTHPSGGTSSSTLSPDASPSHLESVVSQVPATSTVPVASSTILFAVNLKAGDHTPLVTTLQNFLIHAASGPGAAALAKAGTSTYFGALTKAALIEYQKTVGISPASGYCGPMTRAYIASHS